MQLRALPGNKQLDLTREILVQIRGAKVNCSLSIKIGAIGQVVKIQW
ncbi:MAG: hypothetical protein K0S31_1072 [Sphingobacterium multivorum]|nr:hypothetical protein [Sphingobacterium multivorum]